MQSKVVVVIGVGEVGGVFARALLRRGLVVIPVNRGDDMAAVESRIAPPELVLISVGEQDLQPVLVDLPAAWRHRAVLIQNELLPRDWLCHNLISPSIASIWFEKKKGQDVKVVIPTPIFGPHAILLQAALSTLDIPALVVQDETQMLLELVRKNLYILVTNICGLETAGTVGELWASHEALAREVANEVLDVQCALVDEELDRGKLLTAMLIAFDGDPDHKCRGRSAAQRLQRAIAYGDEFGLELPVLRRIAGQS